VAQLRGAGHGGDRGGDRKSATTKGASDESQGAGTVTGVPFK
jgi:hypothetical protein